jgi:hypothetical protein
MFRNMADLKANIAGDYFFTARFLRANIEIHTHIADIAKSNIKSPLDFL